MALLDGEDGSWVTAVAAGTTFEGSGLVKVPFALLEMELLAPVPDEQPDGQLVTVEMLMGAEMVHGQLVTVRVIGALAIYDCVP